MNVSHPTQCPVSARSGQVRMSCRVLPSPRTLLFSGGTGGTGGTTFVFNNLDCPATSPRGRDRRDSRTATDASGHRGRGARVLPDMFKMRVADAQYPCSQQTSHMVDTPHDLGTGSRCGVPG